MTEKKIIRNSHHEFTKGRSCLIYNKITSLKYEEKAVNVVFLSFIKAFDSVFHEILIEKLLKYGLDEQVVKWIENWLNGQSQSTVISGAKTSRRPGGST